MSPQAHSCPAKDHAFTFPQYLVEGAGRVPTHCLLAALSASPWRATALTSTTRTACALVVLRAATEIGVVGSGIVRKNVGEAKCESSHAMVLMGEERYAQRL